MMASALTLVLAGKDLQDAYPTVKRKAKKQLSTIKLGISAFVEGYKEGKASEMEEWAKEEQQSEVVVPKSSGYDARSSSNIAAAGNNNNVSERTGMRHQTSS